jgi:hypothetical protein
LITTSPPNAREAACGLPVFPHTKLQMSESLMGELLQSLRLPPPFAAENAILVQGHVMLKPIYE